MLIDIMGTTWAMVERSEKDDPLLKDCDGYTDWTTKEIVIEREIGGGLHNIESYVKKVKRHEIVHAFLLECGLDECSGGTDAWASNEVMVDWIARIGPRIYETWKAAGVI